jgi:hypothetical protein
MSPSRACEQFTTRRTLGLKQRNDFRHIVGRRRAPRPFVVADPEAAVPVADRFRRPLVCADQQERRVEDSADSTGN